MYTREINGKLYEFKFGIGFVRDIDKTKVVDGDNGEKVKQGLTYAIAGLMDEDFEKLIDCLMFGNKYANGEKLDRKQVEAWLEEEANVHDECEALLDFFESANFTQKKTKELKEFAEKNKALADAQYKAQLEKVGTE